MILLFTSLKQEGASIISKDQIDIDGVNVKCLKVIQPLLIELE